MFIKIFECLLVDVFFCINKYTVNPQEKQNLPTTHYKCLWTIERFDTKSTLLQIKGRFSWGKSYQQTEDKGKGFSIESNPPIKTI